MARLLNPTEGGSDSRNLAPIGKLQLLQQIYEMSSGSNGNTNPVMKTNPEYVGIVPQLPNRIDDDEKRVKKKREKKRKNNQDNRRWTANGGFC